MTTDTPAYTVKTAKKSALTKPQIPAQKKTVQKKSAARKSTNAQATASSLKAPTAQQDDFKLGQFMPGIMFRLLYNRRTQVMTVPVLEGADNNPYGHPIQELRKNPDALWQQVHRKDFFALRDHWTKAAKNNATFDQTSRIMHKDDKVRWARFLGKGHFDEDQSLYSWDGMALDVTSQLKNEQALVKAKEDAVDAHRTKTDFLARMSHELRTPLNAIIGFSDLMMNEAFGPLGLDRYKEYAVDINNSGNHLLALINDILDMSKIESGKYVLRESTVDIKSALTAVVRQIQPLADKSSLPLRLEIDDNIPLLKADDRLVRQIVLNMLSNAVKFTPEGHVLIKAVLDKAKCIRISVQDTGIGMNDEQIKKALVPFGQVDSTLNRQHDGTGLGLALIQSFTAMHSGRFDIRSTPGKGTEMIIRFPANRCVARSG